METIIYTLTDPRDNSVKYVGKSYRLNARYREHLKEEGKYRKITWINKLRSLGLQPIMEELDRVSTAEEDFWEIYWIAQIKAWGFELLNHTKGGHNPPIVRKYGADNSFKKPEVASKIMEMNHARKGKTYEELYGTERATELKQKIKERTQGEKNPRFGAVMTEETKNKIGEANSGENNGMFGKHITEEHREKLREANTGKVVSDETKEKIRRQKIGSTHTMGTRHKISKAVSKDKNPNFKGVVYQYTKEGILVKEWAALYEIKAIWGNKFCNICSCIKGKIPSAYGYVWTRKKPD